MPPSLTDCTACSGLGAASCELMANPAAVADVLVLNVHKTLSWALSRKAWVKTVVGPTAVSLVSTFVLNLHFRPGHTRTLAWFMERCCPSQQCSAPVSMRHYGCSNRKRGTLWKNMEFSLYSVCWDWMQVGVWTATVQLCSTIFFNLNDRRKVVDDRPPHLGINAHAAASEDESSSCSWPQRVGGHQRTGDSKTASSLVQSTGKIF